MDIIETFPLKLQARAVSCLVLVTQTKKLHTVYELLKRLFDEYVKSM